MYRSMMQIYVRQSDKAVQLYQQAFGAERLVHRAYEALRDDAQIICPIGPRTYSPLMVDLIDKYMVRWCIFV